METVVQQNPPMHDHQTIKKNCSDGRSLVRVDLCVSTRKPFWNTGSPKSRSGLLGRLVSRQGFCHNPENLTELLQPRPGLTPLMFNTLQGCSSSLEGIRQVWLYIMSCMRGHVSLVCCMNWQWGDEHLKLNSMVWKNSWFWITSGDETVCVSMMIVTGYVGIWANGVLFLNHASKSVWH